MYEAELHGAIYRDYMPVGEIHCLIIDGEDAAHYLLWPEGGRYGVTIIRRIPDGTRWEEVEGPWYVASPQAAEQALSDRHRGVTRIRRGPVIERLLNGRHLDSETDPGTPVGLEEVAELLGVKRATADQWRQRGVLPAPTWTTSGRPLWAWGVIERWARETGRMRGPVVLKAFPPGAYQMPVPSSSLSAVNPDGAAWESVRHLPAFQAPAVREWVAARAGQDIMACFAYGLEAGQEDPAHLEVHLTAPELCEVRQAARGQLAVHLESTGRDASYLRAGQ